MKRCETAPSAQRQLGCRVGVPEGGAVDTTFWLCNSELFFRLCNTGRQQASLLVQISSFSTRSATHADNSTHSTEHTPTISFSSSSATYGDSKLYFYLCSTGTESASLLYNRDKNSIKYLQFFIFVIKDYYISQTDSIPKEN